MKRFAEESICIAHGNKNSVVMARGRGGGVLVEVDKGVCGGDGDG